MRKSLFIAAVICMSVAAPMPSFSQVGPLSDQSGAKTFPQQALRRLIKGGCRPGDVNRVMADASFTALANWLDLQGRRDDARRVRLIRNEQITVFNADEEDAVTLILNGMLRSSGGSQYDLNELLPTAIQLLGGEEAAIRYMTAAQKTLLAGYTIPSQEFFKHSAPAKGPWVGYELNPDLAELSGNTQVFPVKISFQLPQTMFRYLVDGVSYGAAIAKTKPSERIFVNQDVKRLVDKARLTAAQEVQEDVSIPLRDTLSQLMAKGPETTFSTTEQSEKALTYAAFFPNICLQWQSVYSSIFFAQTMIDETLIPNIKARGEW